MMRNDRNNIASEVSRLACVAALLGAACVAPALIEPSDAAIRGAERPTAVVSLEQPRIVQPRIVQARINQAWRTAQAANPEARPGPTDVAAAR